jgi:hypothetical protein
MALLNCYWAHRPVSISIEPNPSREATEHVRAAQLGPGADGGDGVWLVCRALRGGSREQRSRSTPTGAGAAEISERTCPHRADAAHGGNARSHPPADHGQKFGKRGRRGVEAERTAGQLGQPGNRRPRARLPREPSLAVRRRRGRAKGNGTAEAGAPALDSAGAGAWVEWWSPGPGGMNAGCSGLRPALFQRCTHTTRQHQCTIPTFVNAMRA